MTESDPTASDNEIEQTENAPEDDLETSSVDLSELDDDDTISTDSSGQESGSKKKKKKKKKKKTGKEEPQEGKASNQQAANADKLTKEALDKRFSTAMDSLRNGNDEWIDLSNANLHDAKTKKVAEALKNNSAVTALNMSGNCISDSGAQAIASVLGAGGGPEIIELDLRGNNLTDAGLTALQGLNKLRKLLTVKTGSLEPPEPPSTLSSSPFTVGKHTPRKGGSIAARRDGQNAYKDITQGPMFKKYFQTGEEAEEEENIVGSGFEDPGMLDMADKPEDLWDQLKEALNGGDDNVPAVSSALWTICIFLEREVCTLEPPINVTALEGLKPHARHAAQQLSLLDSVLQIVPKPVTVQFSGNPQPAVGSHRLWATEVLALLLHLSCIVVDQMVASTQLVPKVLDLAFSHPLNNALQTRAFRILNSCLHSQHRELWEPLLEPQAGSDFLSVQERTAQIVKEAQQHLPGKRTANVGFALTVTRLLDDCCNQDEPAFDQCVRDKLQSDEAWDAFWHSEVAQTLWKEHEGVLGGGQRPKKYDPIDDQREMEARIVSGHKLLSILQGMNAVQT